MLIFVILLILLFLFVPPIKKVDLAEEDYLSKQSYSFNKRILCAMGVFKSL